MQRETRAGRRWRTRTSYILYAEGCENLTNILCLHAHTAVAFSATPIDCGDCIIYRGSDFASYTRSSSHKMLNATMPEKKV